MIVVTLHDIKCFRFEQVDTNSGESQYHKGSSQIYYKAESRAELSLY